MRINIVVAMGLNGAIGADNGLPWEKGTQHADMRRFINLTGDKPVIVGRKTYESFTRRPLPRRTNIVITSNESYDADGISIARSFQGALAIAQQGDPEYCSVIGGAQVYKDALEIANVIHLTQINQFFAADTFFPKIDYRQWYELTRVDHRPDSRNIYSYSFITLCRII